MIFVNFSLCHVKTGMISKYHVMPSIYSDIPRTLRYFVTLDCSNQILYTIFLKGKVKKIESEREKERESFPFLVNA